MASINDDLTAAQKLTFAEAARLIEALREAQLRALEEIGLLKNDLRELRQQIVLVQTSMQADITDARLWFTFGTDSADWITLSIEEVRALKRVAELQLGAEQKRNRLDR